MAVVQPSVVAWGHPERGGDIRSVKDQLEGADVEQVWSTGLAAFLAKLKSKQMVAWGHPYLGGDISAVKDQLEGAGVEQVWSTDLAFLAKLNSNQMVAWGHPDYGGDIRSVKDQLEGADVEQVWSTGFAFLAKLKSNRMVAWGHPDCGGDIRTVKDQLEGADVEQVWSTGPAFLAKLKSNRMVAWGGPESGGDISAVKDQLEGAGVEQVWSTSRAFLAKLNSNQMVAWGHPDYGGDIRTVKDQLEGAGVEQVWSTNLAFLAKLKSKQMVAWGDPESGGDIGSVKDQLEGVGVGQVWSTGYAFFVATTFTCAPTARMSLMSCDASRHVPADEAVKAFLLAIGVSLDPDAVRSGAAVLEDLGAQSVKDLATDGDPEDVEQFLKSLALLKISYRKAEKHIQELQCGVAKKNPHDIERIFLSHTEGTTGLVFALKSIIKEERPNAEFWSMEDIKTGSGSAGDPLFNEQIEKAMNWCSTVLGVLDERCASSHPKYGSPAEWKMGLDRGKKVLVLMDQDMDVRAAAKKNPTIQEVRVKLQFFPISLGIGGTDIKQTRAIMKGEIIPLIQ